MKSVLSRKFASLALGTFAAAALCAAPLFAADYKPADNAALVKLLPSAKHTLAEVIGVATKGGETAIEAKLEAEDGKLMIGVYTSVKGLGVDAEADTFKEYAGIATEAAWKAEVETFADAEHIARSAQYHALLAQTKHTLLEMIAKAEKDRPGKAFEAKAVLEGRKPMFSVLVAHDGTSSRLLYDLVTGAAVK